MMGRATAGVMVLGLLLGGGCSDEDTPKEPITIGLVAPKSGALAFVGQSFEKVFNTAIAEINAKGGINGHELIGVVKDSTTDPATAAAMVQELIDEGAVASCGPATSGEVGAAFSVARDNMFPIISPSATAPGLGDPAMTDDGGFMFRNVPNDNIQGIAMAYYLRQVRDTPVTTAAVIHEDTAYGSGLAGAFTTSFTKPSVGGMVVGSPITFAQNGPSNPDNLTAATDVIEALKALSPTPEIIVMVGLEQDGLAIVKAWDADGSLPDIEWFLTDGARSTGFLTGLPTSMVGTEGTAPTFPTLGPAYGQLEDAFADAFPGEDVGQEVFAPNVWDCTYLIATGLLQQSHDGEAFGGAGLRDSIMDISRGPGVILHAGQWRDITTTVNAGGDVDYDGAAGPNDFDENGEAIGPYEVWRIIDNGGTLEFDQVLFLEAGDIEMLLGN